MPGATVGIEHRIGRVGERAVHVAPVARVRRAVDRRAHQRMRETHPGAELDQPAASAGRPASDADPEAFGGAPQQARVAERLGRRGQEQELRISAAGARHAEEAVLDAPRHGARVGQPEPAGELGGVSPRGSSINASGLPRASSRIRVLTCSSSGPGISRPAESASIGREPLDHELRQTREDCSSLGLAHREQKPTRSARSRRATNASVCADTRSSHCASSTMHTSGCSSAASATRLRTASPTRNRSGGGPALSPNAVLSASRCGPAVVRAVEHRPAQRVQAGERELHLRLDPVAHATGTPAACRQVSQQRRLADACVTAQDERADSGRRGRRRRADRAAALADAVEQARVISRGLSSMPQGIMAGRATCRPACCRPLRNARGAGFTRVTASSTRSSEPGVTNV